MTRRRPLRLLLPAILLTLAACGAAPKRSPERGPNIVLIISDDQGWMDYGFMDHPAIRTPNLDRLASESLLYTRGYVPASLCRPSLATLMTGLYPHQHGITGNDPDGDPSDPANRARMVEIFRRNKALTELLGAEGYLSYQSGKWWEGDPTQSGFSAGMTHGDVSRGGRHGDEGLKIGRTGMQPVFDFIESAGERPFFLWYAPFLPHTPHNPPERLLAKYRSADRPEEIAKYYAMVEWFDETVGELLDFLDDEGLRENTAVVYVCDNGWVQTPVRRLWYTGRAKVSPYEAGVRTPIMLRLPGRVEPERDEETFVSGVDLAPTILRLAGVAPPEEMPGLDLRDRAALSGREAVYGELFAHTAVEVENPAANLTYRWVIRGGWKLILPYTPNREVTMMISGQLADWMRFEPELYNVIDDPGEEKNLAAQRPELVQELRAALDEWWSVAQR